MTVDPAPPAQLPAPADAPRVSAAAIDAEHQHEGGYRDTIESILIAFILAFIFRAFVVEAFVIPTGSMAPTLLGAHARFTCDDCGYAFEANYSSPGGSDQNIPAEVGHVLFPTRSADELRRRDPRPIDCPNCGHTVHDPDDAGQNNDVPVHYGDRILVLKYAYLFQDPKRWDVVVFKSPDDPSPGSTWYTTNFIKRLVGRPNESVMIVDGDVYVRDAKGGSEAAAGLEGFRIQGKPRHVQDALWRVVVDGAFVPRSGNWKPWRVESGAGWDLGTPEEPRRDYTFDAGPGGGNGTLLFDNDFVRDGITGQPRPFTDELAYAQAESGGHNVSDVKLSLLYHRKSGDGPLRLSLSKRDHTFTAELTPTGVKLFRKDGKPAGPDDLGQEIRAAPAPGALAGNAAVLVDFMNVDHEVTLRVAGVDLLRAAHPPDVAALVRESRNPPKPEVRISAANQSCAVSDVSLWRDVYYTAERSEWATPQNPIRLGADEYFVLGDNTVISKDARYWTQPVRLPGEDLDVESGRVPGRFLLGKAFFVYWPAGFRPFGSPELPGVIPNFAGMRFIH